MRSKLILAVMLVAFVATGAMADQIKTEKGFAEFSPMLTGPAYDSRELFEGFESGVFPPAGWFLTDTGTSQTWVEFLLDPSLEGLSAASHAWTSVGEMADDVFGFDFLVDVAGGEYMLSFWTAGDNGGNGYPADAVTVEVNGAVLFDFYDGLQDNFIFEKRFIDLTPYDGTTVTIGFRYTGEDDNRHYFDAIMIDDGVGYDPPPPPEAPENDVCEGAIDLQEQGLAVFDVDLCAEYTNAYNAGDAAAGSCTGWSSNGVDAIYKIYLMAGETFNVTELGSHDNSIWLATDCADLVNTCVAGADATFTGEAETFSYDAAADGWYYLVVDGYSGCSLTTVTIDNPVSTEDASFGAVKSMYR